MGGPRSQHMNRQACNPEQPHQKLARLPSTVIEDLNTNLFNGFILSNHAYIISIYLYMYIWSKQSQHLVKIALKALSLVQCKVTLSFQGRTSLSMSTAEFPAVDKRCLVLFQNSPQADMFIQMGMCTRLLYLPPQDTNFLATNIQT